MSESPVVPVKFKWIQVSPDPHDLTMRNSLEPVELFVEVDIPLKHEYIRNSERIIKLQLDVDATEKWSEITPILSVEGMKYALNVLSLKSNQFEPEVEEDWESEEDWDQTEDDAEWED